MGGSGSDAVLLVKRRENFDETFVEVVAWAVPASEQYPDGVRYSMQYGHRDPTATDVASEDGTIIRYDNFPDHPEAPNHHKHLPDGSVEGVEFPGLRRLAERFKREVSETYGEPWD